MEHSKKTDLGFGESQLFKVCDFGSLEERLRRVPIEQLRRACQGSGAGLRLLALRRLVACIENSQLYQKRKKKRIGRYSAPNTARDG